MFNISAIFPVLITLGVKNINVHVRTKEAKLNFNLASNHTPLLSYQLNDLMIKLFTIVVFMFDELEDDIIFTNSGFILTVTKEVISLQYDGKTVVVYEKAKKERLITDDNKLLDVLGFVNGADLGMTINIVTEEINLLTQS